jgi:hypothetical protein
MLSYSYPRSEHNPFSVSIEEVQRLDTAFTEAVGRAAEMIAKQMNKAQDPLLDKIQTHVRRIAQAALASLFSDTNVDNYEALMNALAPREPDAHPVELKNGSLASLLGQFNFAEARAAAEQLLSPQLGLREDVDSQADHG